MIGMGAKQIIFSNVRRLGSTPQTSEQSIVTTRIYSPYHDVQLVRAVSQLVATGGLIETIDTYMVTKDDASNVIG